jgi:hypothetical protein
LGSTAAADREQHGFRGSAFRRFGGALDPFWQKAARFGGKLGNELRNRFIERRFIWIAERFASITASDLPF